MQELRHIVHMVEPGDLLRHWHHGRFEQWLIGNRSHVADLNELTVLAENRNIRRGVLRQDLSLGKFRLETLGECSDAFVFQSAIDELFVLE